MDCWYTFNSIGGCRRDRPAESIGCVLEKNGLFVTSGLGKWRWVKGVCCTKTKVNKQWNKILILKKKDLCIEVCM